MLPLIKVQDTIDVVCTTDPSVKVKSSAREVPSWQPASDTRHSADALVITVRPLSSSEMLRCQGFLAGSSAQAELTVHAAKAGTVRIKGPDIDYSETDLIDGLLERLQPGELAALGGFVLTASLSSADPTNATG